MSKIQDALKKRTLQSQYETRLPSLSRFITIRQLTVGEDYLLSTSLFTTLANFSNSFYKMIFDTIVDKEYFKEFHSDEFTGFCLACTLSDTSSLTFSILQHSYNEINLETTCSTCNRDFKFVINTSNINIQTLKETTLEQKFAEYTYTIQLDTNLFLKLFASQFSIADYLQTLNFLSIYKPTSVAITDPDRIVTDLLFTFLSDETPPAVKHFFTRGVYKLQLIEKKEDNTESVVEEVIRDKSDIMCFKFETVNTLRYFIETLSMISLEDSKSFGLWYVNNVPTPYFELENVSATCQHCGQQNTIFFDPTLYFLRQIFEAR
jgi:Zn finger protein HypA/HybF involved in hydrogenase expression